MQLKPRTVFTSVYIGSLSFAPITFAQPLDFVTVGAPGNADASPQDFPLLDLRGVGPIGRVDYEFRIMRTEVTTSQWLEFVEAYTPFYSGTFPQAVNDWGLQGLNLYSATGNDADPQWFMFPGSDRHAADVSWVHATRFCNWLHNGKVNAAWAFETGAYDTSTYVDQGAGVWTGQGQRSPDARFWIPSLDEWTKAMFYDPNKFGPGVGGYNAYPTGSDIAPVSGLPGTPNATTSVNLGPDRFNVGSYPSAASPWGLLDGSGGLREMVEWDGLPPGQLGGMSRGTSNSSFFPDIEDRLDFSIGGGGFATTSTSGLRIAASIPSPTPLVTLTLPLGLCLLRRRTSSPSRP
ncbi:MAG: SUMF1/EgtB/PvdO family nonheme iron enzyme [Phycisphaerae bacterium]|jgi:sulfatase modifying factor 1